MQILIIEDDASIRDMLMECLTDEGYTVVTASDGQQGLSLLQAQARLPDLILLDLTMPVMSGWEVLEALRADPRLAPLPLLVLSAAGSVVGKEVIGEGAPVVMKPVDLEVLLDLIASTLGSREGLQP